MDIVQLVNLLAPYLPFLLGLGQKAVEKGAEKLGEEGAEKIWNKLSPPVSAKPAAIEAAEDLAKNPDDQDALVAFRYYLKKILEAPENEILVAEISNILEDTQAICSERRKIDIKAERSIFGAIGDNNTVNQSIGINSLD